jgi:hypothetical protein
MLSMSLHKIFAEYTSQPASKVTKRIFSSSKLPTKIGFDGVESLNPNSHAWAPLN